MEKAGVASVAELVLIAERLGILVEAKADIGQ